MEVVHSHGGSGPHFRCCLHLKGACEEIPLCPSGRLRGHEGQALTEKSRDGAESDPSGVSEGTCSHVASRAFSF